MKKERYGLSHLQKNKSMGVYTLLPRNPTFIGLKKVSGPNSKTTQWSILKKGGGKGMEEGRAIK